MGKKNASVKTEAFFVFYPLSKRGLGGFSPLLSRRGARGEV